MNCVPHGWPGEGRRPLHGFSPELKERQHWSLPIEHRNLCDTTSFQADERSRWVLAVSRPQRLQQRRGPTSYSSDSTLLPLQLQLCILTTTLLPASRGGAAAVALLHSRGAGSGHKGRCAQQSEQHSAERELKRHLPCCTLRRNSLRPRPKAQEQHSQVLLLHRARLLYYILHTFCTGKEPAV